MRLVKGRRRRGGSRKRVRGWHLLFGDWADLSEGLSPLTAYRCPKCKRVEFFDPDESLPVR